MPAARGFTPTLGRIKDWADTALTEPDGVTLIWTVPDFSLAACAQHARGFQTSFTSLRAKARRQVLLRDGIEADYARDQYTQGPYDVLACVREPLADGSGWSVTLCRGHDMFQGVKVVNARTGEPLKGQTPEDRERSRIIMKAQKFPDDVTQEEYDFVDAKKFGDGASMWNLPNSGELWFARPGGAQSPPAPKMEGLDHLLPQRGNLFAKRGEEG